MNRNTRHSHQHPSPSNIGRHEGGEKDDRLSRRILRRTAQISAGVAISGAVAYGFAHHDEVIDAAKDSGIWVAPALAVTETLAWGGGAGMILAAGEKVGNPLTMRKRLKEVAANTVGDRAYNASLGIATLGSLGTSSIVLGVSLLSKNPESIPPAAAVAVLSAAPALGLLAVSMRATQAFNNETVN